MRPTSYNSKCCPNCRCYQILASFYALICLIFLVVLFSSVLTASCSLSIAKPKLNHVKSCSYLRDDCKDYCNLSKWAICCEVSNLELFLENLQYPRADILQAECCHAVCHMTLLSGDTVYVFSLKH